ncbi:MAG: protein kinase domain-containing protein [Planctomycetota bacterium]|jgi:serine/threonine protein kinase/tetratricopeptide (TPR) repeat protein
MDDLKYQAAKKLFLDICDLPAGEREKPLTEATGKDPQLREEVESLLKEHDTARSEFAAAHTVASGGGGTVAMSQPPSDEHPKQIGPYRIIHELGRGGMGVVLLGERDMETFRRRVAIKVLKRGMDTDEILKRFKLEEQLLASMNHPGISRLYDAGVTDDGLPFFAMEYIEGLDLEAFCESHRLSIQERLVLFRKVCDAVHYAHQNLVVHRDLKPGNIIVTEDGQPKLLDFGIAKLINPDLGKVSGDPTAPEFRVMTPEYASPEQVRGNPITTASDIYSLGVMLYELLSGHAPYQLSSRARPELERVICELDPERPSTAVSRVEETHYVNPATGSSTITPESVSHSRVSRPDRLRRSIAGDLDNIVLMAMRKEPQRRYASAEQMSEDIQRHLDGLPVIARADTFTYRTMKFVGRNRAGVAAAAAIVVLLAGGITGTTSGWQAERAQRKQVQVANQEIAAQKEKVETHLHQVVGLSGYMLEDLHRQISVLDGSLTVRKDMIGVAKKYLEDLAAEVPDDAKVRREVALAHHRIGGVYGGIRNPNEGDLDLALEEYGRGLELRKALREDYPDDLDAVADVAASMRGVGDVKRKAGEVAEAFELYEQALKLREELAEKDPDDPYRERGVALALNNMGDAHLLTGDKDKSLEYYERSAKIRRKLMAQNPDNTRFQRDVATINGRLGGIYQDRAEYEEALVKFEDAVRIRQRLADSDPSNARWARDVAVSRYFVATMQIELGELDEAQASFEFFRDTAARFMKGNETDARARRDFTVAEQALGNLEMLRCNWPAAIGHFESQQNAIRPMYERQKTNTEHVGQLAESYEGLGRARAGLGRYDRAIEDGREALRHIEQLAFRDENDVRRKEDLARINLQLGSWLLAAGDTGEARSRLVEARKQFKALRDQMPKETTIQSGYAHTLRTLSELNATKKNLGDALDYANQALAVPPIPRDRAEILRQLARVQHLNGDAAQAIETAESALQAVDAQKTPDCTGLRGEIMEDLKTYRGQ